MQTDRHDGNLSTREVRTTSASEPGLRVAEIHTAGPGPARSVPGPGRRLVLSVSRRLATRPQGPSGA